MVDVTRIKTIKEKVSVWPERELNYYKVDVLASNNSTFEIHIHESEYQIWKWYMANKSILPENQVKKILELIEDFGDHRYDKATQDSYEGSAGSDL